MWQELGFLPTAKGCALWEGGLPISAKPVDACSPGAPVLRDPELE